MFQKLCKELKNPSFKIKELVMVVIVRLVVATAYLLRSSSVVDKLN